MDAALDLLRDPVTRQRLLVLVLLVDALALAAIVASRKHAPRVKVIWGAIVVLLPVVGAIAWLAVGRERRGRR